MVATRAMAARKAPAGNNDKENDSQLALRKKPLRRATAKAAPTETTTTTTTTITTTATAARPARKGAAAVVESSAPKPSPLSPKKITQVARGRVVEAAAEAKKAAPAHATRSAATTKKATPQDTAAARAKRSTRGAAAAATAKAPPAEAPPPRAPVTRRKAALPAAARGKAARVQKKPEPEPKPEPQVEVEAGVETAEEEAPEEAEPVQEAEAPAEDESEAGEEHHADEPEEEEDGKESEEEVEAVQTTPTMRITRSHDVHVEHEKDQEEEEEKEDDERGVESDDELCGPITPMRRGRARAREAKTSATARKLQTPARQFLVHRTVQGTPQTQRMPLKAAAASSPQRPMTVSRAADKAMVFRPLNEKTPVPERLQSDQHDHHDESDVHGESDHESSADELDDHDDRDITMNIEINVHDSASEDELAGHAPASDTSEDEDEEEDEELDRQESDYEDMQPDAADDASDSIVDDSDVDDSVLPEPQLQIDLESAPSSPASDTIEAPQVEIDDSELLSSPAPSTPASVIRRNLGHQSSPTDVITPAPRLSTSDHGLLSQIIHEEDATPNPKSRLSFSTATAKMLQTPRMQFAPGGYDAMEIDDNSSVNIPEPMHIETGNTLTINPSLLAVDENGVELASQLENAAAIPTPFFDTSARQRLSMGLPHERMSLLPQDDIFNFVDFDHISPAKAPIQTPSADVAYNVEPAHDVVTPRPAMRRQSYRPTPKAALVEQTPKNRRLSEIPPTPPSYARSTLAFDARRKSMPAISAVTPDNALFRPRTADTTIKPATSDMFAKLWASKQRRPSVRHSTIGIVTPKVSGTPIPVASESESTRKRNSTPLLRSISALRLELHQASPKLPSSTAKPRRHTPTSSLKPSRRSSIRRSVSPQKRYEAPRTPMKTPLKAPCLATPAAYPMTPHPSQPLKSVTALVEVFTLDGSSASSPFIALLQRLGARTTKSWSDRVTHVVFKDGSPTTLQKVRLSQKEGKKVHCVNSRWVTDCDRNGTRMDEQIDIYTVDVDDVPRGGRRRRKSMEPAALKNVDGNVVPNSNSGSERSSRGSGRRSSAGRQSFARNKSFSRLSTASSFWGDDSPVKATPRPSRQSWDEDDDEEMVDAFFDEPTATFQIPVAQMAFPTTLEAGQQTAPVNRLKKMRLRDEDNRRLTFTTGKE